MLTVDTLTAALQGSSDGIVIAEYDPQNQHHRIVFANRAYENMSGQTSDELIGQPYQLLLGEHRDPGNHQTEKLREALHTGTEHTTKIRNYARNERPFWNQLRLQFLRDESGTITHLISINKDVTQEEYVKSVLEKVNVLYREMSNRLEYTNETDPLTKLKSRGHLSTRGEFILGAAKREKLRLHAILVDVDNYPLLSSAAGQPFAEECLVQVADVVRRYFCRATDIAIRLEDNEFVILCIEDDDHRVIERAEMLRTEVRSLEPEDEQRDSHSISVSVGVFSLTPEKSTTLEEIIHNAGQLVFQGACGKRGRVAHACVNSQEYPPHN